MTLSQQRQDGITMYYITYHFEFADHPFGVVFGLTTNTLERGMYMEYVGGMLLFIVAAGADGIVQEYGFIALYIAMLVCAVLVFVGGVIRENGLYRRR